MIGLDPKTFGFFPGNCRLCKQEKPIGAPAVARLTEAGLERWPIENLRGHCEECLETMGLSHKGVFVPVGELVSILEAMNKEIERLEPLVELHHKRYLEQIKSWE
jgi:hypothetical protein